MVHRLPFLPRLLPRLLCLIILSLAIPPAATAQEIPTKWRALGTPGGVIAHLSASEDGRTVYAVSSVTLNRQADQTQWRDTGTPVSADALYRSTDGGATWLPATNDLPPGRITQLWVDSRAESVWVGLREHSNEVEPRAGPWRSFDQGHTWQRVRLDRNDLLIRSIGRDARGELLIGAMSASGASSSYVYRSADNGATWTGVELSPTEDGSGDGLAALIAHPVDARLLFVLTTAGKVLRSGDGGSTWSCDPGSAACAVEQAFSQLIIEPEGSRALLLLGARGPDWSVLRSGDSGATWSEVPTTGLPEVEPGVGAAAALGNGVLLASTAGGTYRSADRGRTWQPLEGALSAGPVLKFALLHSSLDSRDPSDVLAATGYGLFASSDAGALWRPLGTGLPANPPLAGILTHPDQPSQLVAPIQQGRTSPSALISRDAGRTWLPSDGGNPTDGAIAWAIDPTNSQGFVLAGWEHVSTTRDGGVTWTTKPLAFGKHTAIAFAPSAPGRIYVDGNPGLVSLDGGETWAAMRVAHSQGDTPLAVEGIAVHPADGLRVWAGTDRGVLQSWDGGASWEAFGLDGQQVRWLSTSGNPPDSATPVMLFAGVAGNGIMRWSSTTEDWQGASNGLPAGSNIIAFVSDERSPGLLWAARDGGGVYRSTDNGDSWQNAGIGVGDNLGLALAVDYAVPGGLFMTTATAGVWSIGSEGPAPAATQTPPGSPISTPSSARSRSGVDARIEIVWPHDFATIDQAQLANIGIRLFMPESLQPPDCGWRPKVRLWRAVNTEPALPFKSAEQRSVDGQPFPYWEANDVDVSPAQDASAKVYFLVRVDGVDTATSVWAHAADARTFFPEQLVPSGLATGAIDAVDARIQIVWPHDAQGVQRGVNEASLANVMVTLFKHGTRLSVPRSWRPEQITLYGAWNNEIARPLAATAIAATRQSGAIVYPAWEFNDVPVDRAMDPTNRLYLWVEVKGVQSYPTIWAHGLDSRTFFPATDESIQGCLP